MSLIPFCTCYTAASRSLRDIAKATPDSDHRDGLTIVTKELAGKAWTGRPPRLTSGSAKSDSETQTFQVNQRAKMTKRRIFARILP